MDIVKDKYFVILSEGAYSDYFPEYYMGDTQITKEELDQKGREIGDMVIAEYEKLPLKEHINYTGEKVLDRFDGSGCLVFAPSSSRWFSLMEDWLSIKGYKKISRELPEININYSDIPHN